MVNNASIVFAQFVVCAPLPATHRERRPLLQGALAAVHGGTNQEREVIEVLLLALADGRR